MSINTDAPVVAAEELPLQAAMAVRLGLSYEQALLAVTLVPAPDRYPGPGWFALVRQGRGLLGHARRSTRSALPA
jgi:hypothetical protein